MMGTVTLTTTAHERALIDAIRYLKPRGAWATGPEIAARTGQTPQGVAEVAQSARRKNLVRKVQGKTAVHYSLTHRGWGLATPRAHQAEGELLRLKCGHHRRLSGATVEAARAEGAMWCPKCELRRSVAQQ